MENKFQIIIGSPVDHEELVAYIWINGEEIAIVHKEDGVDKMKIKFFDEKIRTEVYLDIFIEALQDARKELMK